MSWLTSWLGIDAQHNADQKQQLANQYGAQAASGYNQLGGYGAFDRGLYQSNITPFLQAFMDAAGLSNVAPGSLRNPMPNTANQTPGMQFGGTQEGQQYSANQQNGGNPSPTTRTATPSATASMNNANPYANTRTAPVLDTGRNGNNAGINIVPADNPSAGRNRPTVPPTSSYAPETATHDYYALTPARQAELNNRVDQIRQQEQNAIADFQAQMIAQGRTDPREMQLGIEHIKEQFGANADQTKAQFADQTQQQQQAALQSLLSLITGIGSQGSGEVGNAAAGYTNLANGTQQTAFNFGNQASQDQSGLLSLLGLLAGQKLNSTATG